MISDWIQFEQGGKSCGIFRTVERIISDWLVFSECIDEDIHRELTEQAIADRPRYFVIDEQGNVKPTNDILEWGSNFSTIHRQNGIAKDTILKNGEEIDISTVFLGIDHGVLYDRPQLFETMVFGGEHDEYTERYSTKEEALFGHERILEMVIGVDNQEP